MTTKPFFVATVDMFQAAGGAQEYEFAMGATPMGLFATTVEPLEDTGTLYLSDDGYTSKSTDAGGVVVYRPKIASSIGIDRQIPLVPSDGAGSWSFGALEISDTDDEVSSLLRSWNIDAQNVTVRRGVKTFEDFGGYRSNRQTKGWYINVDGELTEAAVGEIRWGYSTGTRTLLNEAAGTNYVANPRAEGAVAGSPGTAPTGWTLTGSGSGITQTVVGRGTEDGFPYVDIRYAGTATTGINRNIGFVTTSAVAASVGQTWTVTAYVKLQAGSLSGLTSVGVVASETGGASSPNTTQTFTPTSSYVRYSVSRTLTIAGTTNLTGRITIAIPNGGVVDVTLRIAAPQIERASSASTVILPEVGTPAVTSRDMERLYTARQIWTSPALAELETVFTGMAGTWTAGDDRVTIPLWDMSYWLDRPLQSEVYAGSGTYEGTAEMAGIPKPKTRGAVYNIEPVLIDPVNLIYQYSDAAGTVVALYERGAEVITFESNTTDLYSGSTTAGYYRTDNSRGIFQLGSPPVGQITIDATGQFPTGGAQTVLADIARYILAEDTAVPSAFIDTIDFDDAATAYPYDGGIYIAPNQETTARAAVAYLLSSFAAKLIVGRDGKARVLALRAASTTATPVASLGEHNTISVRAASMPAALSPPPYRIRVGYQHNHTIQTDTTDLTTDTHREFVQHADRYATVVSAAIQASYRRPNDLPPFGGALGSSTDAAAVAADCAALWCQQRQLYAVRVPIEVGLGLDLGDTILLTWPTAFLRLGQRGITVQEQFRSQEETTFMVLI